jgi:drug/metabolite transporter (DMT)-like permease
MNTFNSKLALALGILCISIFPILVRLHLTGGLISAFYRMFIAAMLLIPYVVLTKKLSIPSLKNLLLAGLCGIVFASDIAIWNIAIQKSSASQATLLANLSPVWVGIISFLFLKNKPSLNFWIGTIISLFGMIILVGFQVFIELNLNLAFMLAVLAGILYSIYLLISKSILVQTDVLSFLSIVLFSSSLFLGLVCWFTNQAFTGFTPSGWFVLFIQGAICQLVAWILISYSMKHLPTTRVSVSLLAQSVLAIFWAWLFLDEKMNLYQIIGAVFLLLGIRFTFYSKTIWSKKYKI